MNQPDRLGRSDGPDLRGTGGPDPQGDRHRMADAGDASLDVADVAELAEPFMDSMSLPAVSKHVRVLEKPTY